MTRIICSLGFTKNFACSPINLFLHPPTALVYRFLHVLQKRKLMFKLFLEICFHFLLGQENFFFLYTAEKHEHPYDAFFAIVLEV